MNLTRKDPTLNPRILSCLCSLLCFNFAFTQSNSNSDSYSIEIKKSSAIQVAKLYLEGKFSNQVSSRHFVADSSSSFVICDNYKTFYSSTSAYCQPVGFEIAFHVTLNTEDSSGILQSHLFLPIDSSLVVVADSLEDVWRHGFFEAWENVISNKYKVKYRDVLEFAKEKGLFNYEIDFSFERKGKRNFRFYWFVSEGSVLYRINPQSGTVKKRKLLPVNVSEDGS